MRTKDAIVARSIWNFNIFTVFFFSVRFFGRFFCSSKSTGRQWEANLEKWQWWLSKFCLIGFVDLELERRGSGHVGIRPSSAFVPEARPAVRGRRFPHDVDVHLLPPGAALSVRVETASGTTPATPFALSLYLSLFLSHSLSFSLSPLWFDRVLRLLSVCTGFYLVLPSFA